MIINDKRFTSECGQMEVEDIFQLSGSRKCIHFFFWLTCGGKSGDVIWALNWEFSYNALSKNKMRYFVIKLQTELSYIKLRYFCTYMQLSGRVKLRYSFKCFPGKKTIWSEGLASDSLSIYTSFLLIIKTNTHQARKRPVRTPSSWPQGDCQPGRLGCTSGGTQVSE